MYNKIKTMYSQIKTWLRNIKLKVYSHMFDKLNYVDKVHILNNHGYTLFPDLVKRFEKRRNNLKIVEVTNLNKTKDTDPKNMIGELEFPIPEDKVQYIVGCKTKELSSIKGKVV